LAQADNRHRQLFGVGSKGFQKIRKGFPNLDEYSLLLFLTSFEELTGSPRE
jgi:hypothetical protein